MRKLTRLVQLKVQVMKFQSLLRFGWFPFTPSLSWLQNVWFVWCFRDFRVAFSCKILFSQQSETNHKIEFTFKSNENRIQIARHYQIASKINVENSCVNLHHELLSCHFNLNEKAKIKLKAAIKSTRVMLYCHKNWNVKKRKIFDLLSFSLSLFRCYLKHKSSAQDTGKEK